MQASQHICYQIKQLWIFDFCEITKQLSSFLRCRCGIHRQQLWAPSSSLGFSNVFGPRTPIVNLSFIWTQPYVALHFAPDQYGKIKGSKKYITLKDVLLHKTDNINGAYDVTFSCMIYIFLELFSIGKCVSSSQWQIWPAVCVRICKSWKCGLTHVGNDKLQ